MESAPNCRLLYVKDLAAPAYERFYTGFRNLILPFSDSTLLDLAPAMQMYFLSLRRKGSWNTYEASNVLMSIMPDLIALGSTRKHLDGKVNEQIDKFPCRVELTEGEELRVVKETGLPLY